MSETHSSLSIPMRALMIRPDRGDGTASGRAFADLSAELNRREIEVISSQDSEDAHAIICSDSLLQCVMVHWDLAEDDGAQATGLIHAARQANRLMPIFLTADRSGISNIPADILTEADDFI